MAIVSFTTNCSEVFGSVRFCMCIHVMCVYACTSSKLKGGSR